MEQNLSQVSRELSRELHCTPAKNVAFQHLCLVRSEQTFPVQLLGREKGKRVLVEKSHRDAIRCIPFSGGEILARMWSE